MSLFSEELVIRLKERKKNMLYCKGTILQNHYQFADLLVHGLGRHFSWQGFIFKRIFACARDLVGFAMRGLVKTTYTYNSIICISF